MRSVFHLMRRGWLLLLILMLACGRGQVHDDLHTFLEVAYTGKKGQIEIGGPFVGIEMHHSSPSINRISFFYPVANSLDLSTDYWRRDQDRVLFFGLKVKDQPKKWIGLAPFQYRLTPYSILFEKNEEAVAVEIQYRFCKNKPAMVVRITITNHTDEILPVEVYTHLETSLRTSHSYRMKNKARTHYQEKGSSLFTRYDDPETGHAEIFVANAGLSPLSFTTDGETMGLPGSGKHRWMQSSEPLSRGLLNQDKPGRPIAAYVYREEVESGGTMNIIQIIGSGIMNEGEETVSYLLEHYQDEVEAFERFVLNKSFRESTLNTGEDALDHSVHWAKAIMAVNQHYLDGAFVPMPCPAEYNFFFTHDVLLTDLSAVLFDTERVRRDLAYLVEHADSTDTIPHAYYWKDHQFITEYAGQDNWNHFWFILLCARYLRHTQDIAFLRRLLPCIERSLNLFLSSKKDDDLMWARHPDWWDIGNNSGPRAYMTILAARTIQAYCYISFVLNTGTSELNRLEAMALRMKDRLTTRLWDREAGYLMNYLEDGKQDPHLYTGSILACHFDCLDQDKIKIMMQTVRNRLLDAKLGIYNAVPMDFHELKEVFRFHENEMGDPYIYMNGGIWPQGNAWYALALIASGDRIGGLEFIRNTMSLGGIMNSPNGQPAMYEYRTAKPYPPQDYGKIDKPQFLWAGGWYLYVLYNLVGVREHVWNIGLDPFKWLDGDMRYTLRVRGKKTTVLQRGTGRWIGDIRYDGKRMYSAVVPGSLESVGTIDISLGPPRRPYVYRVNSILDTCSYDRHLAVLDVRVNAFVGHEDLLEIISPSELKAVLHNGDSSEAWHAQWEEGIYHIRFRFRHETERDSVRFIFEK